MAPTPKYTHPREDEAPNISAKVAHYIVWCNRHHPNVRIRWFTIAQTIYRVQKPSNKTVSNLKRMSSHIAKILREQHQLGWDPSPEGARALSNVHDIVNVEVARQHKKAASRIKRLNESLNLANDKRHQFDRSAASQGTKKYLDRLNQTYNTPQIAAANAKIRGLLGPPKNNSD